MMFYYHCFITIVLLPVVWFEIGLQFIRGKLKKYNNYGIYQNYQISCDLKLFNKTELKANLNYKIYINECLLTQSQFSCRTSVRFLKFTVDPRSGPSSDPRSGPPVLQGESSKIFARFWG